MEGGWGWMGVRFFSPCAFSFLLFFPVHLLGAYEKERERVRVWVRVRGDGGEGMERAAKAFFFLFSTLLSCSLSLFLSLPRLTLLLSTTLICLKHNTHLNLLASIPSEESNQSGLSFC